MGAGLYGCSALFGVGGVAVEHGPDRFLLGSDGGGHVREHTDEFDGEPHPVRCLGTRWGSRGRGRCDGRLFVSGEEHFIGFPQEECGIKGRIEGGEPEGEGFRDGRFPIQYSRECGLIRVTQLLAYLKLCTVRFFCEESDHGLRPFRLSHIHFFTFLPKKFTVKVCNIQYFALILYTESLGNALRNKSYLQR